MAELREFRNATRGSGGELSPYTWVGENTLGDVSSLILHFVTWWLIISLIEGGASNKLKHFYYFVCKMRFPKLDYYSMVRRYLELDEYVLEEEERVKNTPDLDLEIKVDRLRKVYLQSAGACNPGQPFCAIERLSFGVSKGECFALLGVNGAGKTTTFKTLVAEEKPTEGEIKIRGMNIVKNFETVRNMIGYCPQFNPIFESLTVE
jgi:ABC-type transport system involved in cytochrome bd biosynthesis fused ATPase/permease subunit